MYVRPLSLRVLASGTLLLLTLSARANADAWMGPYSPVAVRSSGMYGVITFATVEPLYNPAGCAAFYVVSNAHQPQQALAILLSTYAMQSKVQIYVLTSGCDASTGGIVVTDVMTSP